MFCANEKIPYFLIEASIARSRLSGPWSGFAASADAATKAADVVFYLTEKDRAALEKYQSEKQELVYLAPFLNQTRLNQASLKKIESPAMQPTQGVKIKLLTVGMHRFGDKLASYRIIADALPYLQTPDWQLSIVGDGPARADIEKMFAVYGGQVKFLGQLDRVAVAEAYQRASVFVWPGVNEAFGLVYLEAQAAGLPVVAQDRAGVREVIASPQSLVPEGDPQSIARAIYSLLGDASQYQSVVQAGQDFVRNRHLLGAAAHTLSEQLSRVLS